MSFLMDEIVYAAEYWFSDFVEDEEMEFEVILKNWNPSHTDQLLCILNDEFKSMHENYHLTGVEFLNHMVAKQLPMGEGIQLSVDFTIRDPDYEEFRLNVLECSMMTMDKFESQCCVKFGGFLVANSFCLKVTAGRMCPRFVMMRLYEIFRETEDTYMGSTIGFPDLNDIIWHVHTLKISKEKSTKKACIRFDM